MLILQKKIFFDKLKHFILFYSVFPHKIIMKTLYIFSNIYWIMATIFNNNKHIHLVQSFFILFTNQSFEMFPEHKGVLTIAESLPLTNK